MTTTTTLAINFLILLSYLPAVASQADVYVTAVVTESVTLPCHVDFTGYIMEVIWMDPSSRTISRGTEIITDAGRYSVNHDYSQEWNLVIDRIQRRDQGEYTCSVFLSATNRQDTDVRLDVHYPPEIDSTRTSPSVITVNQGDDVTLQCYATGNPPPTITWYKFALDGVEEQIGGSDHEHSLISVSVRDAGSYRCVARNDISPETAMDIKLNVNFDPVIELPHQQIRQLLGRDTVLECVVVASAENLQIYWTRDGERLQKSDKYHIEMWEVGEYRQTLTMRIRELEAEDFNDYTCNVDSAYGRANATMMLYEWRTGQLRVIKQPPSTLLTLTSQKVTIPCMVTGMSDRDVLSWWYNHKMIYTTEHNTDGNSLILNIDTSRYHIEGEYSLQILNSTMSDAGSYMCDISGKMNYTTQLTVIDAPHCNSTNTTLYIGDMTNLTCTTTYQGSTLPLQMDWVHARSGRLITSTSLETAEVAQKKVDFSAVDLPDDGEYVCHVREASTDGVPRRMSADVLENSMASCHVIITILEDHNSSNTESLHQTDSNRTTSWLDVGGVISVPMALGLWMCSLGLLTIMFSIVLCSVVKHYRNKLAIYRPVATSSPATRSTHYKNGDPTMNLLTEKVALSEDEEELEQDHDV